MQSLMLFLPNLSTTFPKKSLFVPTCLLVLLASRLIKHPMNFLNKEPNPKRIDSSTERKILKKIPWLLLLGTVLPLLCVALVYFFEQFNPVSPSSTLMHATDDSLELFFYMMIGLITFIWTMLLTLALGCVIMIIMKGPRYSADSYELSHKDRPDGTA